MSATTYWEGKKTAKLSAATVSGGWGRKAGSLKFANKVLATWAHDSRKLRSAGAKKALRNLEDMGRSLSIGGKLNWGGVKTMWDACQHLSANRGKWTDSYLSYYASGSYFGGYMDNVPYSLANFAANYDANVDKLVKLIKQQQKAVKGLKKAIENKPRVEWKTINEPLKQFDEYTKAIEPLMVMCPEGVGKKGWTYPKTIGKFTGAMDDLMSEVRKSGDIKTSVGVTALAFIVGECVPVFGSLYAEAIKGVPNAIRYFENIKYERNLMMAKVYGSSFKMYGR